MPDPTINIKILTDLKTLNTSLDSVAKRIDTWSKTSIGGFLEFGKAIAGVTIRLGAMAAPFVGTGLGIFKLAKGTADAEEQLMKMSKRLGISVEDLSRFKTIAYLADSSVDEFATRLSLLSNRVVDASKGVGDSSKLFDLMGIKVRDSSGNIRNMTDIVLDISAKFNSYADGAAKANLANELMGRGGNEFIVVFEKIHQLFSQTQATITTPMTVAASEFNDNLKQMKIHATDFKHKIGNELIPTLTELFKLLTQGSQKKQKQTWLDDLQKTLHGTGAGGITDIRKMPFQFEGDVFLPKGEAPSVGGGAGGMTDAAKALLERARKINESRWIDREGNMAKLVDDLFKQIDGNIQANMEAMEEKVKNSVGYRLGKALADGFVFSAERSLSDVLTNLFTGEKIAPLDMLKSFGRLIGRTLGDSIAAAAMQPLKNFFASLFGGGVSLLTSFFSATGAFTGFSSGGGGGGGGGSMIPFGGLMGGLGVKGVRGGITEKGININIGSGFTPREIGDMVTREVQESYSRNSAVRKVIKGQR